MHIRTRAVGRLENPGECRNLAVHISILSSMGFWTAMVFPPGVLSGVLPGVLPGVAPGSL